MSTVKVCGEEVPEAEYKSAIKFFEELNGGFSSDPAAKDVKVRLLLGKVKMKRPTHFCSVAP